METVPSGYGKPYLSAQQERAADHGKKHQGVNVETERNAKKQIREDKH